METKSFSETISKVVMYLGALVVIVLLLWGIFGDSPTVQQLIMGYVVMLTGYLISLNAKTAKLEVHSEITKNTLKKVGQNLEEINRKLGK